MDSISTACLASSTYSPNHLLNDLKSTKSVQNLHKLHSVAIKTGQIHDPLVAAEALRIAAISKHPDLNYAHKLFDQMLEPNIFSYNTLIRAYSESNEPLPLNGLDLFIQLLCYGSNLLPNRFTFPPVLKLCAKMKALDVGKQMHCMIIKMGFESDGFVLTNLARLYLVCNQMTDAESLATKSFHSGCLVGSDAYIVLMNILIDGYFRGGRINDAKKLFDEMKERSVVSWNGLISKYVEVGLFKEAVDIFRRMQVEKVKPNYVTLVSVLPAISRIGSFELGKWVHLYAKKNGIFIDDVLGSALIDMYSKCGDVEKAIQVFEKLPKKNSITWNALISGLATHGQAREAIDLFKAMQQALVFPSDVTFIGILNACSHVGLIEEGQLYFNKMVNVYGLMPRVEHYGCMIDMLCRGGLLEEAEEMVKNMPIEADDVIYKALLSGCYIHKNSRLGEWAADKLIELSPYDGGSYVLLSNLYASLNDWESVANVRLRMKGLDIRKDPGCSWIDVNGFIHEFVVEDESHSQNEEIRSMLKEMSDKVKEEGHVSDTRGVLLNIDEEEKQNKLLYHSEKIAIAFGLISTKQGEPIKVVKNLRVCVDCHDSIKLVSKVYGRRIVVRDRSRFHHFENGICSCNDYW